MDHNQAMKMIFFLLASALCAQDAQDNPTDVLVQARQKLSARTSALTKYTCVQTVDRSYFVRDEATPRPSCDQISATRKKHLYKLKLDHTDRLRLEVSLPATQEIVSWTDSGHFELLSLNELINYGPNATGTFGSYLAEIFSSARTHFQYRGREGGLLEYGFYVSPNSSRSFVNGAGQWTPTAYDGTFSINIESFEVERLTVNTADLPPETGLCLSESILDYRNTASINADPLLPREGKTEFVLREGHQEIENLTTFSGCREIQTHEPRPQLVRAMLPDNLRVALEFIHPIDSDQAAQGDPITARVAEDVKGSKEIPGQVDKQIYIIQGSIVRGRIMRIEHHLRPDRFLLTLVFETVEIGGTERQFELVRDGSPTQEPVPIHVSMLRSLQTLTLHGRGSRIILPARMRTDWRTSSITATNGEDPSASLKNR
jgi:hypothetical protein